MASFPKRVYWDACTWIALIQKEKIRDDKTGRLVEDREQMCRDVIEAAKKGKIEIVSSTLCLAEVCKHPDLRKKRRQIKLPLTLSTISFCWLMLTSLLASGRGT
jgi:hypothetical protein